MGCAIIKGMVYISRPDLKRLYLTEKNSVADIASTLLCSQGKINYWLRKFNIQKRSISEAVYLKNNPCGDPFKLTEPETMQQAILYGVGVGLYWGEGTKSNRYSVRLGNTDPDLVQTFLLFLEKFFNVPKENIRFGIQIFSDISLVQAERFWVKSLQISKKQLMKTVVTNSGKIGTYRNKCKYGVITLYFHNTKMRDELINLIEKMRGMR